MKKSENIPTGRVECASYCSGLKAKEVNIYSYGPENKVNPPF
jgi:hypothetical protein